MTRRGDGSAHERPDFEVWVVDRISEGIAVLYEALQSDAEDEPDENADDTRLVVEVAASLLGDRAVEGAVLLVPLGGVGEPMWDRAERDEEAEAERRRWATDVLDRLKGRDPGGDVSM